MKPILIAIALVFCAQTASRAQGMGDFSFGLDLGFAGYSPVNKAGFYGEFTKLPAPEFSIFGRYDHPESPFFIRATLPYLSTGRWALFILEAETQGEESFNAFYHYRFNNLFRMEFGFDFDKIELSLGYGAEMLTYRQDPQSFLIPTINEGNPFLGYLRGRATVYAGRVFYFYGQYDRQIHGHVVEFEAVGQYGERSTNEVRLHGIGFGIGVHFFNNTER